jgi:hypothetical protein
MQTSTVFNYHQENTQLVIRQPQITRIPRLGALDPHSMSFNSDRQSILLKTPNEISENSIRYGSSMANVRRPLCDSHCRYHADEKDEQ